MISYKVLQVEITIESGEQAECVVSLPAQMSPQDVDRLSVAIKTEIERNKPRADTGPGVAIGGTEARRVAMRAGRLRDGGMTVDELNRWGRSSASLTRLDAAIEAFERTGDVNHMVEALDQIREILRTIYRKLNKGGT